MKRNQSYGDPLLTSSPRETVQTDKHRTRFGKILREVTSSPALQHALRDTRLTATVTVTPPAIFTALGQCDQTTDSPADKQKTNFCDVTSRESRNGKQLAA